MTTAKQFFYQNEYNLFLMVKQNTLNIKGVTKKWFLRKSLNITLVLTLLCNITIIIFIIFWYHIQEKNNEWSNSSEGSILAQIFKFVWSNLIFKKSPNLEIRQWTVKKKLLTNQHIFSVLIFWITLRKTNWLVFHSSINLVR